MTTATETKTYTCKLTIVTPGHSDKVMNIRPADAPEETVWTDHQPGIERLAAIQRFLQMSAKRGTAVPPAAAYHNGKDLRTVVLEEADIPTVELEPGLVFETLKPEPTIAQFPARLDPTANGLQKQIDEMNAGLAETRKLVEGLAGAVQSFIQRPQESAPAMQARKAGRPRKARPTEGAPE